MGSGKSGSVTMPQANAVTQANSQPAMGSPNRYSQTVGMGSVGMGSNSTNVLLDQAARPIRNYPNDPYQPGMQSPLSPYNSATQLDTFAGMTGGNITSQHTAGGMGPYRPGMQDITSQHTAGGMGPYRPGMQLPLSPYNTTTQQDIMGGNSRDGLFNQAMKQYGTSGDQARLGQAVGNPLANSQGKGYGGKVTPSASQKPQQNMQPVDTGSNNYY